MILDLPSKKTMWSDIIVLNEQKTDALHIIIMHNESTLVISIDAIVFLHFRIFYHLLLFHDLIVNDGKSAVGKL